jgi:hypothetical protein
MEWACGMQGKTHACRVSVGKSEGKTTHKSKENNISISLTSDGRWWPNVIWLRERASGGLLRKW